MPKEITGNITYKFIISDANEWIIEYGNKTVTEAEHIHNDMAALAIAQLVMETCAVRIRQEKEEAGGKAKKYLGEKLNKVIDGRFGLKIICDYLLDCYEPYMAYLKEKEALTTDEAKEIYKANKAADEA